jgi:hypothetical protein
LSTPHTASPAPIATTNVFKILIADVKNAINCPETQTGNKQNYLFCTNKKPPVSTDGSPFPVWLILSFLFCIIFIVQWTVSCPPQALPGHAAGYAPIAFPEYY